MQALTAVITIDEALRIATEAHKGQRDRANKPYILHPLRVGMAVSQLGEEYVIVGFLHDVFEDSDLVLWDYKDFLSESQFDALDRLTKVSGESRRDNFERVKLNPIATAVKIADLEDNLDITRLKNGRNLQLKDLDRINDYSWGWHYLTGR